VTYRVDICESRELLSDEAGQPAAGVLVRLVAQPKQGDLPVQFAKTSYADGSGAEGYEEFNEWLTVPEEMNDFPRTIFGGAKTKHYNMITWHDNGPAGFSMRLAECGYFDTRKVLLPGYDMTAGSFSYGISDHCPMWARFT
jgi:hypothetical protein